MSNENKYLIYENMVIVGEKGTQGIQGQTGSTGATGKDSVVPGPIGATGPQGPSGVEAELSDTELIAMEGAITNV